ncbi:MAG: helix-turn-helix transcriptional regulator [Clostridia bacterium]|nr:helix-turn-helix transcriptional regulator [Clostridia bacterium]
MYEPYNLDKHEIFRRIGANIALARTNANLTQGELAEMIGCSPQFLGRLERGERTITLDHVFTIASVLNISPVALMTDCFPEHLHADYGPDFLSTRRPHLRLLTPDDKERS